jgi:hypothetical protein
VELMSKSFIKLSENIVVNINWIHSITLNKNKENAWCKVIDEEGYNKVRVTPEQYEEIVKILTEIRKENDND